MSDSDESDLYIQRNTRSKRRKGNNGKAITSVETIPDQLFMSLSRQIENDLHGSSFEKLAEETLAEYALERERLLQQECDIGIDGNLLRPLTRSESTSIIQKLEAKRVSTALSTEESVLLRKLKLDFQRQRAGLPETDLRTDGSVTPLPPQKPALAVNQEIIDALYSIKTTPFENSFLSRVHGSPHSYMKGVMAVDWETQAPWMSLMSDIRAHHALSHPQREQATEITAPIVYASMQPWHLDQVHKLLAQAFWDGIDVSDSFQYSPEKCTIIATYKKMVVGAAFLSSPLETYITYLAVKVGWDNAQIATSMLYHLITLNPNKDITLHVSTNNPAMILYNRFGFKAEEFVAGFYEDYLDPQSRASKNAFRLRLRRY